MARNLSLSPTLFTIFINVLASEIKEAKIGINVIVGRMHLHIHNILLYDSFRLTTR